MFNFECTDAMAHPICPLKLFLKKGLYALCNQVKEKKLRRRVAKGRIGSRPETYLGEQTRF
jgi:hypothetical protein